MSADPAFVPAADVLASVLELIDRGSAGAVVELRGGPVPPGVVRAAASVR
ncbi:hypothetical protein AB0J83_01500 [Actinoplanes sp. NPDC049596]